MFLEDETTEGDFLFLVVEFDGFTFFLTPRVYIYNPSSSVKLV